MHLCKYIPLALCIILYTYIGCMDPVADQGNLYYITSEKFNATGELIDICSNCFQRTCHCPQVKYKGLLCRKNSIDHTEHKEYIASPYRSCGSNNCYTHPGFKLTSLPYFTSAPYFNSTGDLCVLENLLDYNLCDSDYYNSLYHSPTESTLSEDGTYNWRKVYFTFNDKQYPLDLLNYLPTLQKDFIHAITANKCTVIEKNNEQILYNEPDDFAHEIKQKQLQKSLTEMFDIIKAKNHTFDYKKLTKALITDNFLVYALCAKLCGNKKLAIRILKQYDIKHTKNYFSRSNYIPYRPLSGIAECTIRAYTRESNKYTSILEKLNTQEDVEYILNTIKETKIRLFSTPLLHTWYEPNWLIYTKKKINKHTVMVCKEWIGDGHGYFKSAKFKLINAPGEIVKANKELPLLLRLKFFIPIICKYDLLKTISTMQITEKRIDQDGDTVYVNHTLKADTVTDGSQQSVYVPLFSRLCKLVRPLYRSIASSNFIRLVSCFNFNYWNTLF